jgi:serine/threonine protein kinase
MSPEQARGKTVDKRTDIWAFGCVLYEMLTGRRAFRGETSSDAIAAILERTPDWDALPAATPPAIRRLLERCLEKDPKRRLHDIADARFELDDAARTEPVVAPRLRRRTPAILWASTAMILIAIAAALVLRQKVSAPPGLRDAQVERLTFDSGLTQTPALSPDGRLLAYASDRAGRGDLDIWVQQLNGGALVRLTDNPSDDVDPQFSPDGSQIVFRSERAGGGLYLVPALGGTARR